jgi:phosphoribosylanthranilate isomerase
LRVKICGITSVADAEQAVLLGADAVGLNFYPRSPRYITAEVALASLRVLPPTVEAVGLYVNQPLADAFANARQLAGLATVQWHGDAHEVPPPLVLRYVPAFPVRDPESLRAIDLYLDACRDLGRLPSAVLLDACVPGEYGGTGRSPPWELLADFRASVPLYLAGGLTPDNVAEAIRRVRPDAVDVASGVESSPGRKDPEKLRRFIDNARAAAR